MKNTKSSATTKTEKELLVEKILAIDPSNIATEDMSRQQLREALADAKANKGRQVPVFAKSNVVDEVGECYYSRRLTDAEATVYAATHTTEATAKYVDACHRAYEQAANRQEMPPTAPAPVVPHVTLVVDKVEAGAAIPELQKVEGKGKKYVSKTDPNSRYHLRDRSEAAKPVGLVRQMCEANPTLARKEIIKLCVENGINKNTAATQYSLWKTAKTKALALEAARAAGEAEADG